ncbi:hypothetical protein BX616_009338 [Lobosporangium transversale]|uniref:N-acetyltransferase domain-containing protein n=1 Tax=Lobosporangium transversale TaxID=64571 RepID=A0A1Y2GIV7_9FUNG|nr:hypothetical protein BCR41DRAFT_338261 [Lobosporangium transversale]KAF9918323.1 hypothetical protein BX616_009338 [Lobosporangium transversale]ORZ12116.1 hypothetical protein BCR41DRAFT_338261 [Lobosporangium transversale]|eukprot:XP_021879981.1 hypothetical protein BCR41DRAFT_338261 [Lobosporangium transversale]
MSSAYGTIARPVSGLSLSSVLPRHATCRSNEAQGNGKNATLFRIASQKETLDNESQIYSLSGATHHTLVETMHQVFNGEVERGDTYPQEFALDETHFENYFFSGDSFVLVKGNYKQASDVPLRSTEDWEEELLGFFYIKPNYPGRCSHICNGGFVVNPIHRGLGIGQILGKAFLKIVPVIGYKASMFNLVFVSNIASIRLWRRLGFKETGRVPKAGRLRGQGQDMSLSNSGTSSNKDNEGYVDAIQFYWDFETMVVPPEYDT